MVSKEQMNGNSLCYVYENVFTSLISYVQHLPSVICFVQQSFHWSPSLCGNEQADFFFLSPLQPFSGNKLAGILAS